MGTWVGGFFSSVRHTSFVVSLICVLFYSVNSAAVTVSAEDMQGWVVSDQGDFVAPFRFTRGPGTPPSGNGSLKVGPIGSVAANKFILFPPIADIDASVLELFSFDFYINSAPEKSASQFYVNVYIDSPNNGLGVFGSGSFYDCRYDLTADAGLPADTWNSVSFDSSSTWSVITNQTADAMTCPDTLGELAADSKVLFVALNAGDTSLTDEGLVGAFDNVVIQVDGVVTQYDFEGSDEVCYAAKTNNEDRVAVFCL